MAETPSGDEPDAPPPGPWAKGRPVIERLIAEGRLDLVVPDESLVLRQLEYARQHLGRVS
jgi:hypothetical protein